MTDRMHGRAARAIAAALLPVLLACTTGCAGWSGPHVPPSDRGMVGPIHYTENLFDRPPDPLFTIPYLLHSGTGHHAFLDLPGFDGVHLRSDHDVNRMDILRVGPLVGLRLEDGHGWGRVTAIHWPLQLMWGDR